MDPSMIVDVSSPDGVDLLRLATLRFGRGEQAGAFVEAPATLAFVAVGDSNEAIIGWCWGYRLVRPDASSMLYLHGLEVAEEHRGNARPLSTRPVEPVGRRPPRGVVPAGGFARPGGAPAVDPRAARPWAVA